MSLQHFPTIVVCKTGQNGRFVFPSLKFSSSTWCKVAFSSAQAAAPKQEEATPENGMPPAFSTDSALVPNPIGAKGDNSPAEAVPTENIKDSSDVKAAPPAASDQAAGAKSEKGGCCGCSIC